ncbi:hypothetical protein Pla110_32140 [Polystyrenella longa]|uniref:Uncharacterized protein n=1 Tax=Polystyrenella longa TaxID=2528007 RepID=A0A518CQG8_9PLAN|nr:hypothetical protein Pla110_32140 [Polystyrenella longa]
MRVQIETALGNGVRAVPFLSIYSTINDKTGRHNKRVDKAKPEIIAGYSGPNEEFFHRVSHLNVTDSGAQNHVF